jgi:hypothetical protein
MEGYSGVFGLSNTPCHLTGSSTGEVGAACSSDDACEYGFCDAPPNKQNGVCRIPLQICPLGVSSTVECSGHGACRYATGQGLQLTQPDCPVTNTECRATCSCDSGYYGDTCELVLSDVSAVSLDRGSLCSSLKTLVELVTDERDRLLTFADFLGEIYDPTYLISPDSTTCLSALSALSSAVSASSNRPTRLLQQLSTLVSLFATSPSVLDLVNTLEVAVYDSMVPGQMSVSFATDNYCSRFTYNALSSMVGGFVLSAPSREVDSAYGSLALELTLPLSGLSICDGFKNYAKVVVTEWRQSPYSATIIGSSLTGNFLEVSSYPTTDASSWTNSAGSTGTYSLDIPLSQTIDTASYQPVCWELHPLSQTSSKCKHCALSTYTENSALITCNDSTAYFCPVSSGSTRHRLLSSQQDPKIYSVTTTSIPSPSAESTAIPMSSGVVGFMSAYLSTALIGLIILFFWDRHDQNILATHSNSNKTVGLMSTLASAFDESGRTDTAHYLTVIYTAVAANNTAHKSSFRQSHTSEATSHHNENPSIRTSIEVQDSQFDIDVFASQNVIADISAGDGHSDVAQNSSEARRERIPSVFDLRNSNAGETDFRMQRETVKFDDDEMRKSVSARVDRITTNQIPEAAWSELPISSLLSDHGWFDRVVHAIGRHHKWARIFTFPSLRRSRLIRFIVAMSDLLLIVFTNTIFYQIYFPDNGDCQDRSNTSADQCLSPKSDFELGRSLCVWRDNGLCELRQPPLDVKFIVQVCMIVIVFSSIPRTLVQFLLEKVCARTPQMVQRTDERTSDDVSPRYSSLTALGDLNKQLVSGPFPEYNWGSSDHMPTLEETTLLLRSAKDTVSGNGDGNRTDDDAMAASRRALVGLDAAGNAKDLSLRQRIVSGTPEGHLEWKVLRAREEASHLIRKVLSPSECSPISPAYSNLVVLQHFLMEQISPITRFALKSDIMEMDHAQPGVVSLIPWVTSWVFILGVWVFMSTWIINWAVTYGPAPARAWGLVLGIVVLADTIMNQLTQIYLLNIHITEKLRPQLRDIFGVLYDALHNRVQSPGAIYSGLRACQHLSASCRASRNVSLTPLLGSRILATLDDLDLIMCRRFRLTTLREVGVFAWLTLFHPSLLNTSYDLFQRAMMDLVIPVAWCCFILLNYAISLVSPYFLLALYIFAVLVLLVFFRFPSTSQTRSNVDNHPSNTSKSPSSRFRSSLGFEFKDTFKRTSQFAVADSPLRTASGGFSPLSSPSRATPALRTNFSTTGSARLDSVGEEHDMLDETSGLFLSAQQQQQQTALLGDGDLRGEAEDHMSLVVLDHDDIVMGYEPEDQEGERL